ncbi:uncharacterized protein A4U43_C05F8470 [Asparagus officinalis]|uniref:Uncharacterized protein n=1 Tax=Asparagus officinalis TaxID=4686 RepID=A0A5P1EUJ7_ASPOF|nr:uncharacterized protein A4U43_C05F8470 [Asparagus officinalis]
MVQVEAEKQAAMHAKRQMDEEPRRTTDPVGRLDRSGSTRPETAASVVPNCVCRLEVVVIPRTLSSKAKGGGPSARLPKSIAALPEAGSRSEPGPGTHSAGQTTASVGTLDGGEEQAVPLLESCGELRGANRDIPLAFPPLDCGA